MKFLKQEEVSLINLIMHDRNLSESEKQGRCEAIKQNARLRSDGFRKSVKIALNAISSFRNKKIAANYLK